MGVRRTPPHLPSVAFLTRSRKDMSERGTTPRFCAFLTIEGRRAAVFGKELVTPTASICQDRNSEMTPLKSALLTVLMVSGIAAWAAGIYAADASAGHVAIDGYGVTAAVR